MSDFIDDVDDYLLGLFENHDLRENKIKRPQYNIVRNSGNINDSDENLEFYTAI